MNSTGIIIILIVIIICILVTLYINMYNKLTFSNIKINETEAQIDSKLRKKYDLINKSIAIIKNKNERQDGDIRQARCETEAQTTSQRQRPR